MQYEYIQATLVEANLAASQGRSTGEIYRILRTLPLADFCNMMFSTPDTYDALARFLPKMPSREIQRRWNGHSGNELLLKTTNVARLLQVCSWSMRAAPIGGTVLDYGCGWGRLTRLLAYFTDPDGIYALDPMEDSLGACRAHGVHSHLSLIPTKPESLPLQGRGFDFAVAYSVLTHTPPDVTSAVLSCLRRHASPNSVLACTVRPLEFWNLRRPAFGDKEVDGLIAKHKGEGFAYRPVGGGTELTKEEYGEIAMRMDFLSDLVANSGWNIGMVDREASEPWQILVGLAPKN